MKSRLNACFHMVEASKNYSDNEIIGGFYASRQTWKQASAEKKRHFEARPRLSRHQEQALQARQGTGGAFVKLCFYRQKVEEERFSLPVDSTHRSCCTSQRAKL